MAPSTFKSSYIDIELDDPIVEILDRQLFSYIQNPQSLKQKLELQYQRGLLEGNTTSKANNSAPNSPSSYISNQFLQTNRFTHANNLVDITEELGQSSNIKEVSDKNNEGSRGRPIDYDKIQNSRILSKTNINASSPSSKKSLHNHNTDDYNAIESPNRKNNIPPYRGIIKNPDNMPLSSYYYLLTGKVVVYLNKPQTKLGVLTLQLDGLLDIDISVFSWVHEIAANANKHTILEAEVILWDGNDGTPIMDSQKKRTDRSKKDNDIQNDSDNRRKMSDGTNVLKLKHQMSQYPSIVRSYPSRRLTEIKKAAMEAEGIAYLDSKSNTPILDLYTLKDQNRLSIVNHFDQPKENDPTLLKGGPIIPNGNDDGTMDSALINSTLRSQEKFTVRNFKTAEDLMMGPGRHEIPFSIPIPMTSLYTSLQSKEAKIGYNLKAKLKRKGLAQSDFVISKQLPVYRVVPRGAHMIEAPMRATRESIITCSVTIPSIVYIDEDEIVFKLSLNVHDPRIVHDIHGVKCQLKEITSYAIPTVGTTPITMSTSSSQSSNNYGRRRSDQSSNSAKTTGRDRLSSGDTLYGVHSAKLRDFEVPRLIGSAYEISPSQDWEQNHPNSKASRRGSNSSNDNLNHVSQINPFHICERYIKTYENNGYNKIQLMQTSPLKSISLPNIHGKVLTKGCSVDVSAGGDYKLSHILIVRVEYETTQFGRSQSTHTGNNENIDIFKSDTSTGYSTSVGSTVSHSSAIAMASVGHSRNSSTASSLNASNKTEAVVFEIPVNIAYASRRSKNSWVKQLSSFENITNDCVHRLRNKQEIISVDNQKNMISKEAVQINNRMATLITGRAPSNQRSKSRSGSKPPLAQIRASSNSRSPSQMLPRTPSADNLQQLYSGLAPPFNLPMEYRNINVNNVNNYNGINVLSGRRMSAVESQFLPISVAQGTAGSPDSKREQQVEMHLQEYESKQQHDKNEQKLLRNRGLSDPSTFSNNNSVNAVSHSMLDVSQDIVIPPEDNPEAEIIKPILGAGFVTNANSPLPTLNDIMGVREATGGISKHCIRPKVPLYPSSINKPNTSDGDKENQFNNQQQQEGIGLLTKIFNDLNTRDVQAPNASLDGWVIDNEGVYCFDDE